MQVGNQDFAIDLVFYHRGLTCLVAEYQTVLPPKELLRRKLHELYAHLSMGEAPKAGPKKLQTRSQPGRTRR